MSRIALDESKNLIREQVVEDVRLRKTRQKEQVLAAIAEEFVTSMKRRIPHIGTR